MGNAAVPAAPVGVSPTGNNLGTATRVRRDAEPSRRDARAPHRTFKFMATIHAQSLEISPPHELFVNRAGRYSEKGHENSARFWSAAALCRFAPSRPKRRRAGALQDAGATPSSPFG